MSLQHLESVLEWWASTMQVCIPTAKGNTSMNLGSLTPMHFLHDIFLFLPLRNEICWIKGELTESTHQPGESLALWECKFEASSQEISTMKHEGIFSRIVYLKWTLSWRAQAASILRRAVTAKEGSSRLGVLWGLPPLSLVDMLLATGGGFST